MEGSGHRPPTILQWGRPFPKESQIASQWLRFPVASKKLQGSLGEEGLFLGAQEIAAILHMRQKIAIAIIENHDAWCTQVEFKHFPQTVAFWVIVLQTS